SGSSGMQDSFRAEISHPTRTAHRTFCEGFQGARSRAPDRRRPMADNRGWGREGESDAERRKRHRKLWRGVARAFGGAIFFSLPLLMTMEMWWLGFYMDRARLALFMVVIIPVLVGLDRFSGFTEASTWLDDVVDAFVAYGVGIVSSVFVLVLFNVLYTDMPLRVWVG